MREAAVRRIVIALLPLLATLGVVLGSPAAPVDAGTSAASTLLRQLDGVSCVSATFCAAVGAAGDGADWPVGNVPLAMIWNGTRWRETAVPLPKGWTEGQLTSVSCVSARDCVAIGAYANDDSTPYPLTETWTGRSWTPAALARPARFYQPLAGGVSCVAPGRCVAAVSFFTTTWPQAFAETLRGTKWTLREVPLPKGSTRGGSLSAVSCVTAAYCVLAGVYYAQRDLTWFESWNGTAFTRMKAASPGKLPPIMNGVSCASAASCVAVGSYQISTPFPGFAELWNGRTWSPVMVTVPVGNRYQTVFDGVSCVSGPSCMTVGVASIGLAASQAVAVFYDGQSWAATTVPALGSGRTSALKGVSCVSATWCVAVGGAGGSFAPISSAALIAFWDGKSWRLVTAS